MANHKRGKARRHRSLAYGGIWNGNGNGRFRSSERKARQATADAMKEGR